MAQQNHTYPEIMRQPQTWRETLEMVLARKEELTGFIRQADADEILFAGCGSSHFLSIAAAALFAEETGMSARAVPASEVFLKPEAVFRPGKKTLVIGISRSGRTTEVVKAVRFVRERALGATLAVTSHPDSELVQEADAALTFPHVQEKSVVMTGAFTNKLLALQCLAALLTGNQAAVAELERLPAAGEKIMPAADQLARLTGEDTAYEHFVYLGLGAHFGLASEGMLKLKEMTQLFSEAYNPLEFRHGPITMLTERSRVILLSSNAARGYEPDLVRDMRRLGAQVAAVGEGLEQLGADVRMELTAGFSDWTRSVLYLPFMQLMAYHRTRQMGLDPDRPRHLNQVVVLEERGS